VDVTLIENVRLQRVFKPTVLKIMDHVEQMDGWKWRERTAQDKKEIKTFVKALTLIRRYRYGNSQT